MARPRKQDERDHVDDFLEEIGTELPESIDLTVEGIVDRIHGVNWRIRKMLDETLDQQGLSAGDWKVLSALRWQGEPHRRSAGELARIAELTSGTMTARLDQLERQGLVRRFRDRDDRRSVLVELTDAGRTKHNEAMGVQAEKEKLLADALSAREMAQLNSLLRRVMIALQERVPRKPD